MQKPLDNRLILLLGAAAALVFIATAAVIFGAFKSNRKKNVQAQMDNLAQAMKSTQLSFEYKNENNKSNYYYLYFLEDGTFMGTCYEHQTEDEDCSEPQLQRIFTGEWEKAGQSKDGSTEFLLTTTYYEVRSFGGHSINTAGTKTYLSPSLVKAVFQDQQDNDTLHKTLGTLFGLSHDNTESRDRNPRKLQVSKVNQSRSDFVLPLYLHGCLKNHQPLSSMGILTKDMVDKMDAAAKKRLRDQILAQYRCRFEDDQTLVEFYRPDALAKIQEEEQNMQALMSELKKEGLEPFSSKRTGIQGALVAIELMSVFLLDEHKAYAFMSPKDKQNLELLSK